MMIDYFSYDSLSLDASVLVLVEKGELTLEELGLVPKMLVGLAEYEYEWVDRCG